MADDKGAKPEPTPAERERKERDDAQAAARAKDRNRESKRPTGWFRTSGGVVLEYDLPLPESVARDVTRVANADGDPWDEPTADQLAVGADDAIRDVAELAKWLAVHEVDRQEGQTDFAALVAAFNAGVPGPYAVEVALRILRERDGELAARDGRIAELELAAAQRAAADPDAPAGPVASEPESTGPRKSRR